MLCIKKPNRKYGKDTCYYIRKEEMESTSQNLASDSNKLEPKQRKATKRRKTATGKFASMGLAAFEVPSASDQFMVDSAPMLSPRYPDTPEFPDLYELHCFDEFRKRADLKHVVRDCMVRKELSSEELEEALYQIRNYETVVVPENDVPLCGGLPRNWNHRDGVVTVNGKEVHWRLYNTHAYDSRHGVPDSLCLSMVPFV